MYLDKVITARRFTQMMDSLPRSGKGVIAGLVQPSRHLGRATGRAPARLLKRRLHVPLPVTAENQERAEGQEESMIIYC
jgi:hypothetical protein